MFSRPSFVAGVLALSLVPGLFVAAGPCDVYASGNTPCVAAHSTTRALYNAYNGSLYQLRRGSDNATTNIAPLSAGGTANAASHDSFCSGTTCLVSIIYDQSGHNNHLTQAPPGAFQGPDTGGNDYLAAPIGAPVTVNGHKAYGIFVSPGTGYRNDKPTGTATGDAAEGIYAVLDGTHYNGNCCFDYGNAELSATDTGNGHMEALYLGLGTTGGKGSGSGPWVMADLENGIFADNTGGTNNNEPSSNSRFVTGAIKGKPGNSWAIRGANAQTASTLTTFWNGARPANGYNPMSKEGAIILGIGGDNSNSGQGTFYEGAMTTGYPSDSTENSVQANILAAKYTTSPLNSGPTLKVGSAVSIRATTPCCTTRYVAHSGTTVNTQVVASNSSSALKRSASWFVRTGLGNSECFSFESVDTPGSFIRHSGFELYLNANDGSQLFHEDATYCTQTGLYGSGTTGLRSWSYPAHYFRHYNAIMYAASNGGPMNFDNPSLFNDDTSFAIGTAFASSSISDDHDEL